MRAEKLMNEKTAGKNEDTCEFVKGGGDMVLNWI